MLLLHGVDTIVTCTKLFERSTLYGVVNCTVTRKRGQDATNDSQLTPTRQRDISVINWHSFKGEVGMEDMAET